MGCPIVVLCGISSRFQLLFPWYGQIAHALLTRPPLTQSPKGLRSFDLHVLSMPPAFILSQNQTLKFNCLKSLSLYKIITALTLLSLCWLASRYLNIFVFKLLWKINGNYLSICIVSNKISFLSYSIFNLLWPKLQLRADRFWDKLSNTACILYHKPQYLVKQIITLFLIFFEKFLKYFLFAFPCGQLV